MEPVFMITSQSAAMAASLALDDNVPAQEVNYAKLAAQLRADGQLLDWVGGTLTTNGVILDDGNPGVAVSGSWVSGANAGFWGTGYLHDQNSGKGSKYVRFTPDLPFSGVYDVFTWHVANPNRAANAPFDIVHAADTNRVLVNQQLNGSQWVFLLRTNFVAGQGGGVILRNDGTTGFVIADAVRFMPVSPFTVPLPSVDVLASDPQADERGPDQGRFTFVRNGDLTTPLAVSYSVGGTAGNGVDFVALSGMVTFPTGSNSVKLLLNPIADGLAELDESVTVMLQPSNRYQIGALTSATAVIRDADTLPPRVKSIRVLGGSAVIEFEAAAGRSYVLQSTESICPTTWNDVASVAAAPARRNLFLTNAIPPGPASLFFRLETP